MLRKPITGGIILLFLLSSLIPIVTSDSSTLNNIIYVDDDGGADFTSIQEAIDYASDGDTVFVYNGIYYECLAIDKPILLIGEDKDSTIIHAYDSTGEEGVSAIFIYPVENVRISGFTIENTTNAIVSLCMYNQKLNNSSIIDMIFNTGEGAGSDIYLDSSTNITIRNNKMNHGIHIYETFDIIIEQNLIHGKPLVYLEGKSNQTVSNAGQAILNRCENITIMNLEIFDTYSGIQLYKSDSTTVHNNTLYNNLRGIEVRSNYNIIEQNTIMNNEYGILLQSHEWNKIFHNNFISNIYQVGGFFSSYNIWYDLATRGGNYWDDYDGVDGDGDGIGDTPYIIWSNEEDMYPFMNQDGWLNNPPNKPSQPQGIIKGKTGKQYAYSTSTIDVDGDLLYYKWDWGDNKTSDWIGAFISGDTDTESHIWDEEGSYEIKVKARDINGAESPWSDPLSVSMPKNKRYGGIWDWLFERIPLLERFWRI